MTVISASASVAPSGRSRTARRCCSNWLVIEPFMVQCPVLCGRIASSLMTKPAPTPGVSKSSAAMTPVTPKALAIFRAAASAVWATSGEMSWAGAMTSSQTPSTWMVCTTSQALESPDGVRATSAESSRVNATLSSASRAPLPNQSAAARASVGVVDHAHALAVVAAARGLEHDGPAGLLAEGDKLLDGFDSGPRRVGQAELLDRGTHDELVLGVDQRGGARLNVDALGNQRLQVLVRHVFVVEREHVDTACEFPQGCQIFVVTHRCVGNGARS